MGVLLGVVLVLLSWALALGSVILLGLAPASVGAVTPSRIDVIRRSLWWGLLAVALYSMIANLFVPLQGRESVLLLVTLIAVMGVLGIRWAKKSTTWRRVRISRTWMMFLGALGLATGYLALAALGPVTNYDSGLYHIGAARYAAEFPAIPGLANLYFPFGYSSAEFPLAAVMGLTGWAENGFRLVNGFIMILAAADLVFRCLSGDRKPGRFVLAVGLLASWVPLVGLSDYWVTSPTQDSSLWIITFVAIAYLADAISGRGGWRTDGAVAAVLAILVVLLRPTMVVFAGALVLVVVVVAWRRRGRNGRGPALRLLVLVGATFGVAALSLGARDALLSGWLGYPLSAMPFDVDWRVPDPDQFRVAILGFHRDPSNMWGAAQGWNWAGPWFARLPSQWETFELLGLTLLAILFVVAKVRSASVPGGWRGLALLIAPIAVGILAWWTVSPPSFRFAWGLVFGLPVAIIGWMWWIVASGPNGAARPSLRIGLPLAASLLASVTLFSITVRFDWASLTGQARWSAALSVGVPVAPLPIVAVQPRVLETGLEVVVPISSELCWGEWPLCTPDISPSVAPRGGNLGAGFRPG